MRASSFVLALSLSMAAVACGGDDGDDRPGTPDAGPPPSPYVHAFGTLLYDGQNRPFVIRGVNLGAWMFHESWISLFDVEAHGRVVLEADARGFGSAARLAIKALGKADGDTAAYLASAETALVTAGVPNADAKAIVDAAIAAPSVVDDAEGKVFRLLDTRFGVDGRRAIIDAYRGAWITAADLDAMKAIGLNTVRVPTGWRDFVVQPANMPAKGPFVWDELAWARIVWLLDELGKRDMYAVFDIQDSPGGHNDYDGKGTLYQDPAMQALTIELWRELGQRLRDRTEVAAYSLLAEPYAAPDVTGMFAFYDRLHDALRADGDKHLLVIHDGFKGMINLPAPATMAWTNVVYSTHVFDFDVKSLDEFRGFQALYEGTFVGAQAKHAGAFFVGSFSTVKDADFAYTGLTEYLKLWEKHHWSWAIWTWKRFDDPLDIELFGAGEKTGWGFEQTPSAAWQRPDLYRDDQATLISKMATYTSDNVAPNAKMVQAVKDGLK
jgi:hypothetical protein